MSVELSSSFSSEDWQELKGSQDKAQIITVLRHRYSERYFEPFKKNESKHGFSMMAVSCLVIESLISLKHGWKKTNKPGRVIFEEFFSTSQHLTDFTGLGADFYQHIRCGILHQAETTGGWRIRRGCSLPLVCSDTKVIHATKFLNRLEKEFENFLTELGGQEFASPQWSKVVRKIDHIVANCG
ncbi:hypothetical protein [Pseudoalteromonas 'SMAR']|uniref:hypothetical protein n=1 Tax=Pseudoalteromonas 'SMAR' TaxID=3416908 RepID=UPI003AF2AC92